MGFHIEHVNSFNPIFRATRSYADLAGKSDFLKIVVYNNCGGERYASFIKNVCSTVFRDVPQGGLLRFNNHLLNYGNEAGMDGLAQAGLSADYVFRETKRALLGVEGRCDIFPGIDIDIPTGREKPQGRARGHMPRPLPPASKPEPAAFSIRASIPRCSHGQSRRRRVGRPRLEEPMNLH